MDFNTGDKVRFTTELPNSMVSTEKVYTVVLDDGEYIRLDGVPGRWLKTRITKAESTEDV